MKPRTTATLLALCTLAAAGLWWAAGMEARALTTGRLLLLDGKNGEALALAKKLAADHDRSAPAQVFLAQAELAHGNLDAAEAAAKRAGVVATPEQQDGVRDLRNEIAAAKTSKAEMEAATEKRCRELLAAVQNGRGNEVHEEVVALAARNPRHGGCQHLLAVAEWRKHNLRLAMEAFAKAESLASGKAREEISGQLRAVTGINGVIERMRDLVDKDDFAAVVAEAKAAEDTETYDYEIYLLAGSAQLSLGKLDEAKDVLGKARALAPPGAVATVEGFLERTAEAVAAKARADKLAGTQREIRIALAAGEPEKAANAIRLHYVSPSQGIEEKLIPSALFLQVATACVTAAEARDAPRPELYLRAGGLLEMAKATYPDGNEGEQLAIMAAKISKMVEVVHGNQVGNLSRRNDATEQNLMNGLWGREGLGGLPEPSPGWEHYSRWFSRGGASYREDFRDTCLSVTGRDSRTGDHIANHLHFYTDPRNLPPGSRIADIKKELHGVLTSPNGARLYAWMAGDVKAYAAIKECLGYKAEVGKAPCLACNGNGLGKPQRETCGEGCEDGRFYRREDQTSGLGGENTDSTPMSRARWNREMETLRVAKPGIWKEIGRRENYISGLTEPVRLQDSVQYVRFLSEACAHCRGRGYFERETRCAKCKGYGTGPILTLTKE